MIESILLGNREITYELVRKNVKNINLRIKPDMTVTISAHPRVSKSYIREFLRSKEEWIETTLQKFEQREQVRDKEVQLSNGNTLKLLGINKTITIVASQENRIDLNNSNIYIYVLNPEDNDMIKRIWTKWLDSYITNTFRKAVEEIYPLFLKYNITMPKLKFRYMKTRWGSCSIHTGTITLNKALIHFPIACIEYVVAHEFTHFIHPNHSKDFYYTLSIIMPDYKDRRKLLKMST